jgi:very-short-patch-repair endonuclease
MSHYPIIIIPKPLQKFKSVMPQVQKFQEPRPRSPKTPQPIEIKLIILETLGILGISLGLGFVNSLVALGFLVLGLIAIAIQSLILKSNYPDRLQKYEQDLQNYPHKLEDYDLLKAEHDEEVKRLLSPENITEFRQRQLLDILKQTKPHDGTNSKAKRGMSEAKFAKYLRRYFEDNIHERLTLSIPNSTHPYSPDFAYIDRGLNLYIDIEIDEPYSHSQPIHYVGSDDLRNQFFISRGWIVIRFSEEQIVRYPRQCCRAIAEVIDDILGDGLELTRFETTPPLPQVKHWSRGEAIIMIKNQARDRYLKSSHT